MTLTAYNSMALGRITPFLKWTGGKRALARAISAHFPGHFGTYYEPFLGSGAVFFYLTPEKAFLADVNQDLIALFRVVKSRVEELIVGTSKLKISPEDFYRIRRQRPRSDLHRAIRMLYLNKTAFNGIYRVNRRGEFNVPFGWRSTTRLPNEEVLREASSALSNATLSCGDFREAITKARQGDLVYADPPYTLMHNSNGFLRYNEEFFSWQDQAALAQCALEAVSRGVYVVVSNAKNAQVRSLYEGFSAVVMTRQSSISGRASGRGRVEEYLFLSSNIRNRPPPSISRPSVAERGYGHRRHS